MNIFVDWNKDGDWDDTDGCTDEWALQNFALDVSGEPDFTVLSVDFPGGVQVDEFWMRVMLTAADYDPASDNLLPGETEDYLISGGQVFLSEDVARTSGLAQPLGGKKTGNQFLCRGGVVPHGKKDVIFDFEQTTASFDSGFRVRRIQTSISQPTKSDGKRATDVSIARTALDLTRLDKDHQVEKDKTKDGRINLRITIEVTTTKDMPDRLEGPFTVSVVISGHQRDGKKMSGYQDCSFYVDHTSAAALQNPFNDGFFGGPGRAAAQGQPNPKFIFVQHGKTIVIQSDALILHCAGLTGADKTACQQQVTGSRYDKSSVTVFGSDGAVIAPADLKTKAGIKSIKPATNRRVIKIKTVKDKRDPPVETIVVRVKGEMPGGGSFFDYFRVVIIHERGKKATKLATEYNESNVAFYRDEDEATTIAYIGDSQALLEHEAPFGDAIFDGVRTICDVGSPQVVASPFHGSLGFILADPSVGNSNVFYIPQSEIDNVDGGPCPTEVAVNLTWFPPESQFFIGEATNCFEWVVFSEINTQDDTFQLGAVWHDGSNLGPLPVGDSYRDPSCYQSCPEDGQVSDCEKGLVGSTPGDEGRSDGGYVPIFECNLTCTESLPAPKVILPADAPNVHMLGLAVSPDASKIAWYRDSPTDSQVWVGDFDPLTQTVSNHQQLTTEGSNFDPTWSTDGSQIAFVSLRDGDFEIYVMYADGSGQTNITNTPGLNETQPSWQVP